MLITIIHAVYTILFLLGFICIYYYCKSLSMHTEWSKHLRNVAKYKSFYAIYLNAYENAISNPTGEAWYSLTVLLDYACIPYTTDYKMSIEDRILHLPKLMGYDDYISTNATLRERYAAMKLKHIQLITFGVVLSISGYLFLSWSIFKCIW